MAGIYEIRVEMSDPSGEYSECVLHYALSEGGAFSPFEYANKLLDAWNTAVGTAWLNVLNDDMQLVDLTAKKVAPTGGPTAVLVGGTPGNIADVTVSGALGAQIKWLTATLPRSGHTTIPGVGKAGLIKDILQAALIAAVNALIAALLPQLTLAGAAGTADLSLYHRKTKTSTKITAGIPNAKIGVQRRRIIAL